jgi:hypothetical protein
MKHLILKKTCLNKKYSKMRTFIRVCVINFLFTVVGNREMVSAVLFKFCFRICCLEGPSNMLSGRAKQPKKRLKLSGVHQLIIHADDDILLRTVIQTVRKITEAIQVVGKQVGLVVSTERTECQPTSVEQNAG